MGIVTSHLSMSLDGFISGPDQSLEDPLGVGGRLLLQWQLSKDVADVEACEELFSPIGAVVMGRNMFGPIRGPWDTDWRGWWGDDPPYHVPVFVLTRYSHDPIEMAGGTTFHFVTGGFDVALAKAQEVAGARPVRIAGGASTVRQAFAAGALDELYLDIMPLTLGAGERIFDGPQTGKLTQLGATYSATSTHIHYRVGG